MSSIPQPPRSPLDPQRPESIAIWRRWFEDITKIISTLSGAAGISWDALSKAGSNLADLVIRNHNDLENIQGGSVGQRYHLTSEAATTAENAENLFLQLDQTFPQNVVNGPPVFDALDFNQAPVSPSGVTGRLRWNSTEGTLDLGQPNDVTQQIGQETFFYIKNQTGATLTNGKPIMFAGAVGASGRLKGQYAIANGTIPAQYIMGIATQDIADGADGYVTNFGKVRGIDTSGTPYGEVWADGDVIYVSPTTPGGLTKTAPNAPNLQILVAAVVNAHDVQGTLFVRPTFASKLTDLDDVNGTPLTTTGQFPVWNNTAGYFDFNYNITNYLYKPGLAGGQTAIGGTGATDILKLQGTSGNGTLTSPAIQALVGNNGGTTAFTVLNNGNIGINESNPPTAFCLAGGTKSPAVCVTIQTATANPDADFSIIGQNAYFNGVTKVRENTTLTGFFWQMNVATSNNNAGFIYNFLTTAGVERKIFQASMDASGSNSILDIGYKVVIGTAETSSIADINYQVHITDLLNTRIGLAVKGAAAQSANLQEWHNSSDTVLSCINKDGWLGIGTNNPLNKLYVVGDAVQGTIKTTNSASFAQLRIDADVALSGLAAFGSAFNSGVYVANSVAFQSIASGGFEIVNEHASGVITFVTGGFAATNERVRIGAGGGLTIKGGSDTQQLIVKGHTTQTANLTEWQNSGAAVLSSVSAAGVVTAPNYTSTVATGTQPYACTSTTVNTNLNADMLDGKHTGTSGNTVPLLDGNNTWSGVNKYSDNIVLPKTSGKGIQVDNASPSFGFRDLLGEIKILAPGANDPTLAVFRDSVRAFSFSNAMMNEVNFHFHIPHDYVPGSDIFIHSHWSQNVVDTGGPAGAPGAVKWSFEVTYAKGHNQAAFPATFTTSVTQTASGTQYQHMLAEVQLSAASPSATQIDSDILEPDGVIIVRAFRDPVDAADTLNQVPFMHYTDIHYQSTNMATKAKAPNFYT